MMPEISLNILDVAENSVRADAKLIEITVAICTKEDTLTVLIKDDGCGMSVQQLEQVQDPFFTTRTTRKVGLGVPFLKQAAEMTGGGFEITSEAGKGTKVESVFRLSHIDRMPLGDMSETIYTLVVFNEHTHFRYTYSYDERVFTLDTREMREIVGEDVSFSQREVSLFIKDYLVENKKEVDDENGGKI
ncbi:MAG: ATP-binding protein [Lachnospiraceae bacterium]|nr:ATP-binding protein [Lachnospiraceae bacterium]